MRVGPWPETQTIDQAGKPCLGQTLQLIKKIRKLRTKKFYNIGPWLYLRNKLAVFLLLSQCNSRHFNQCYLIQQCFTHIISFNRTVYIRHQCRKTNILSSHRCQRRLFSRIEQWDQTGYNFAIFGYFLKAPAILFCQKKQPKNGKILAKLSLKQTFYFFTFVSVLKNSEQQIFQVFKSSLMAMF